MSERKTRYSIYNCNYHLVWIPKYRRRVLIGDVREALLDLFASIAVSQEVSILAAEVMEDHVHLFVSAPPRLSPADLVNVFKGVTARMLRMRFPQLKKVCPKGLWTRTYYVGTVGAVTEETVRKYVELQKAHEQEG